MKRNELFKSLMNVQSQVTSLMNIVLQESNDDVSAAPNPLMTAEGKQEMDTLLGIFGIPASQRGSIINSATASVAKKENIEKGLKEIETKADLDKKHLVKVEDMIFKMRNGMQDKDVKNKCKYVGIALLALGCIFGYLLYPSMKENFISVFNSGSPVYSKLGSLIIGTAKAGIVASFLFIGGALAYHGFSARGIDAMNPLLEPALRMAANIIVVCDGWLASLKTKVTELKDKSPVTPAWQW